MCMYGTAGKKAMGVDDYFDVNERWSAPYRAGH